MEVADLPSRPHGPLVTSDRFQESERRHLGARRCDVKDEQDRLADRFEQHRDHLIAVAYRMLGSLAEAEDAVQETWLRQRRSDADAIQNLGATLTRWWLSSIPKSCSERTKRRWLRARRACSGDRRPCPRHRWSTGPEWLGPRW
jgi:DNA-directed RNA polymerase specialized sigma24 family protein